MPSEKEQAVKREQRIKKEAKLILDKFAKALERVETKESFVEREQDRREEQEAKEESDSDFQEIFFENAPETKKSCILAERGKWK